MRRSPFHDSSLAVTESAVLRLDAHLNKIADMLAAEGVAEEKIEEICLNSAEMALEMFTIGRRARPCQTPVPSMHSSHN